MYFTVRSLLQKVLKDKAQVSILKTVPDQDIESDMFV